MVVECSVYIELDKIRDLILPSRFKKHIIDESCFAYIRINNADSSNVKQYENYCRRKSKRFL